jgi:hypothetical protein
MSTRDAEKTAHGVLHDIGKVLVLGGGLSLGLTILLFAVFWLTSGWDTVTAAWRVRGVMFVIGALFMLVSAGMLIFGAHKEPKEQTMQKWRQHFDVLGIFPVFLLCAVLMLLPAIVLDWFLYTL